MRYRKLIESAVSVSELGFGAWQLGINSGWDSISDKQAIKMVHHSIRSGVNFFDTAPNYGNGTSEIRLGKAIKGMDRNSLVINTKFGHTDSGELNFNADYIRQSLEGSLKRLQTDYVDSLIIHNPPFHYLDGTKNDHYQILEELKSEGKIRAYGASLDTYNEMKLFMETTNSQLIEVFFNILHQDSGRAFNLAKQKKVGIIVKIPFDSGWLTGKYDENTVFNGIRSRWSVSDINTRARIINNLKHIIGKEKILSQVALSFCLAYDAVSTVIPGCTSISQLESNLESIKKPISPELLKKLEKFYSEEVERLKIPW